MIVTLKHAFEFGGNETALTVVDARARAVVSAVNLLYVDAKERIGPPSERGGQGEVREAGVDSRAQRGSL